MRFHLEEVARSHGLTTGGDEHEEHVKDEGEKTHNKRPAHSVESQEKDCKQ
jgi:hypothetical protein